VVPAIKFITHSEKKTDSFWCRFCIAKWFYFVQQINSPESDCHCLFCTSCNIHTYKSVARQDNMCRRYPRVLLSLTFFPDFRVLSWSRQKISRLKGYNLTFLTRGLVLLQDKTLTEIILSPLSWYWH
jgi:hypothetical protein